MTNLQACIRDYRWNKHIAASAFAMELGVTTREYNRFEEGKEIDTDSLMKIMRWCFSDPDPKAIEPAKEETPEAE